LQRTNYSLFLVHIPLFFDHKSLRLGERIERKAREERKEMRVEGKQGEKEKISRELRESPAVLGSEETRGRGTRKHIYKSSFHTRSCSYLKSLRPVLPSKQILYDVN
jgi:hypothetical protein